jgi:hypothetical protein
MAKKQEGLSQVESELCECVADVLLEYAAMREIVCTMLVAQVEEEIVYAFLKTGRIVTEENEVNLSPEELAEWNAALDEFFEKYEEE